MRAQLITERTDRDPRRLEGLRIDQWLWRARMFKTRSQAAQAVQAGRVQLNGQRVKSARRVQVGDELLIRRARTETRLTVLAVPLRRGPASEAAAAYRLAALPSAAQGAARPAERSRRPGKKDRRLLRQLKGRS